VCAPSVGVHPAMPQHLCVSTTLRALWNKGVIERLQSSDDVDMLVGHVLLLGRILAEVEERKRLSRLWAEHAGVLARMSLFVGREDRDAIGPVRIDPLLFRLYQLLLARWSDMEFPIPAAHAHHAV